MLDPVLRAFELKPDIDLHLMRPAQRLADITRRALDGLTTVMQNESPDVVLIHGDTSSCLAAALAAFYAGAPIAHVEAGLRTGDLTAPFPEEGNRVLVDRLARWHFVPTAGARTNLLAEGHDPAGIHITGNTGIDALLWMAKRVESGPVDAWRTDYGTAWPAVVGDGPIVLVTAHRRESFGEGLADICQALRQIATDRPGVHVVFPVHRNPDVWGPVHDALHGVPGVHLLPPVPYPAFVKLMQRASVILTDSGGIQEEAPSLGKPVLVLRDTTERPEGIATGQATLVGTATARIVSSTLNLLSSPPDPSLRNPYGDGQAAQRIVQILTGQAQ
jgi:UDP-N-acetylglucosamine 2-epimerase (non-hydrolysing)